MRVSVVLAIVALFVTATTSTVQAATVIGQAAGTDAGTGCGTPIVALQGAVAPGSPSYTVAAPGVITQFSHDALGSTGFRLKVFTPLQPPPNFRVAGQSEVVAATQNGLNTFPARISVETGDVIGLSVPNNPGPALQKCYLNTAGNSILFDMPLPEPGPGATYAPLSTTAGLLNISATIEPDVDRDKFGDETQDLCPSDAAKQTDCTAPSAVLGKAPKKKARSRTATFKFSSDDPDATFQCRLDKKAFKPCSSPKKFRKLKVRKHKFRLAATDAAGNLGAETTFRWRVVD